MRHTGMHGGCRMIRVVILQKRRLDRDALAALIRQSKGLSLVAALTTDWETVAVSKLKRPNVVVIDTLLPNDGAIAVANCLLSNEYTDHVIFLGDYPSETWKIAASQVANSGHLPRDVSHDELLAYMAQHCSFDAFSAEEESDLHDETVSKPDRTHRVDAPGLSKLSARENEVLRLIAEGNTLRQCAEMLGLAVSTLDNHKSRLMRKLDIHSTVELVKLAIREGIVTP